MSWRRSPLPRDWRRRRLRVLERDGYRCQIRGPKCAGKAAEVDHIDRDDDHRLVNLRSGCGPCHHSRTGRQAQAAQTAHYRPRITHPGLLAEAPDSYGVANGSQVSVAYPPEGVTPQVRATRRRS
jgi:5-methylcytosine-specific restriction protein A